jgi:hypothetical protein
MLCLCRLDRKLMDGFHSRGATCAAFAVSWLRQNPTTLAAAHVVLMG